MAAKAPVYMRSVLRIVLYLLLQTCVQSSNGLVNHHMKPARRIECGVRRQKLPPVPFEIDIHRWGSGPYDQYLSLGSMS